MNKLALPLIMTLYMACSLCGLDWGLYTLEHGGYLFPEHSPWQPHRVAKLSEFSIAPSRGADVDPNPTEHTAAPTPINRHEREMAEIFARYLLYSGQPDEMITFRALGAMAPGEWDLDPKLYQYGGLFIYPTGLLIKAASLIGWVELESLSDCLIRPRDFAKCYVIGRGMVALWGLFGVWVVYALGKHLGDWRSGALSALLYCLMPVVVSLSHECKPHLPGSVLMLCAVLAALKYLHTGLVRYRLLLAISCGLAVGTVVSSAWIFLLIPLAEFLARSTLAERLARSMVFGLIGLAVYAVTNPYVVINLLADRALLENNLGNSLAMYHVADLVEGFGNACALLSAGSSAIVVVGGLAMIVALWAWNWRFTLVLALPAAIFFVQFALLAAGKPGEYGRFGLFPNIILGVLLSSGVFRCLARRWYQDTIYALSLATIVAWPTASYLVDFYVDSSGDNSRLQLAARLQEEYNPLNRREQGDPGTIGVLRAPAPYNFPPIDFSSTPLQLIQPSAVSDWPAERSAWPRRIIVPLNGVEGVDVQAILDDGYYALEQPGEPLPADRSPLSWANKPLIMLVHRETVP